MKIIERSFGVLSDGKRVKLFTLKAGDLSFSLTNFGATWTSLILPSSRKGKFDDILLGYSCLDGYANNVPYFGVTVGRFANRIKNASFTINGKTSYLDSSDGKNTLHSGRRGFDKLVWKAEAYEKDDGVFVRFELDSPDGEGGFPGNLKATVTYGITKSNEIIADYRAKVDEPCPVNLTNHAYFNLAGEGKGNILSHDVTLYSSSYLEIDDELIPTGKIKQVKDTPFDFTTRRKIMNEVSGGSFSGYDHCFVVDGEIGKLRPCAEVYEEGSGRTMKVLTTQPGVQFYTGNSIGSVKGKYCSTYVTYSGFCLETQHFPDSPNQKNFPPCIAGNGKQYHERAIFAFSW